MLHIWTLVYFIVLLRFQLKRKRNQTTKQLTFPIRNILYEWESRRTLSRNNVSTSYFVYETSLLAYIDLATCHSIAINIEQEIHSIQDRYQHRDENFDLFEFIEPSDYPHDRLPAHGITHAERRYHQIASGTLNIDEKQHVITDDPAFIETEFARSNIVYDEEIDLSGAPPHEAITKIIHDWFPLYEQYLEQYCRPPSFGPQAFRDFNRPTTDPPTPSPERHEQIMEVIRLKFNLKPYRPLHFADALAAETPLNTSSSYFSKFDPRTRVLSRYSTPVRYSDKPTSKGYSFNVTMNIFRTEFHHIKDHARPFPAHSVDYDSEQDIMLNWFARHPAQMFIRSQISLRPQSEPKKIRPVYSVDDRFLHIEKTLVTPALAQLRNPECCVAHGLETFRGSMSLLDRTALFFMSFISLDWSQFDQRLPRYVIVAFFLDYLASLLIISHGYMPTRFYPDSKMDLHTFARKQFNVLIFLLSWYLCMTYLSYDGFSFLRLNGGVPSGLLNTQFLDSFGNMYIIVDCLLEFGFTIVMCLQMLFCVMGDDNLIFLQENIEQVTRFMAFLAIYCESRHGMVLSILKSVFSNLRTKISFLSYDNDFGMPTRPIGKLVAQLAFPERPIPSHREWIHAARALGLAYANCGQDPVFHLLCLMVYIKFLPSEPVPTLHLMKIFKKWKFQLPNFDVTAETYSFPDFPTLDHIRQQVKDYHGPFSEEDKWNFNVFNVPPSDNLDKFVTLKEYIKRSPEMSKVTQDYWNGKRSY
jgi:hypothetical protein